MAPMTNDARILARHHDRTERALSTVRMNNTLDDRQKGRLITQVIAAANAWTVAIMARHRRRAAVRAFEATILARVPFLSR